MFLTCGLANVMDMTSTLTFGVACALAKTSFSVLSPLSDSSVPISLVKLLEHHPADCKWSVARIAHHVYVG